MPTEDDLYEFLLSDDDVQALVNVTDAADEVVMADHETGNFVLYELDSDVETAYDILGIDRNARRIKRALEDTEEE